MNDDEDEKLPPEVRAAFDAAEPPAGFAERVVATWQAERDVRPAPARP
ncbi:MAG: hypothetical protein JWN44_808, partial [Myxococcales bacterium]|nr:hypothetical protein [Myxococcales bacterium]